MILFGNVCICAIKILIGKRYIIVWHNQMKIGWYGIFHKKNPEEKYITSHVPKFVNVHHVVVKLSREVNSYGVIVTCMKGESPVVREFIYQMNSYIHEFIYHVNSLINEFTY